MKVIFRKSIVDQIIDASQAAQLAHKEIEKIELDVKECKRLRRELGEMRLYCMADVWPTNSLVDPGRRITKGDWCTVAGIRIEAAESE